MSFIYNAGTDGIYNESDEFMAGQIAYCAAGVIPSGWLECNGAAISRATYGTLFASIGTNYGVGDGATTFNLPDLRGEFLRGADRGRGVDPGRALGSAQLDSVQDHKHDMPIGTLYAKAGGVIYSGGVYGDTSIGEKTGLVNGAKSSGETRPRNVAVLTIIKYS
ncbi:MAG: phage tail protein [Comamonas sp.]